jgi:hypothetical protein
MRIILYLRSPRSVRSSSTFTFYDRWSMIAYMHAQYMRSCLAQIFCASRCVIARAVRRLAKYLAATPTDCFGVVAALFECYGAVGWVLDSPAFGLCWSYAPRGLRGGPLLPVALRQGREPYLLEAALPLRIAWAPCASRTARSSHCRRCYHGRVGARAVVHCTAC